MAAFRGATTRLGHRTPRTRALDVGTDPRGFSDGPAYDYKRGLPVSVAKGTPSDDLGEVMGQIKGPPMTDARSKSPMRGAK